MIAFWLTLLFLALFFDGALLVTGLVNRDFPNLNTRKDVRP